MRNLIARLAARYGYVKIPPRHAWKLMAEAPRDHLTPYGLKRLPEWKRRRKLVNQMWRAIDKLEEPYLYD